MVGNSITYNNSMQLFDNGSTLNKICATEILKRAYFGCKEALRKFLCFISFKVAYIVISCDLE